MNTDKEIDAIKIYLCTNCTSHECMGEEHVNTYDQLRETDKIPKEYRRLRSDVIGPIYICNKHENMLIGNAIRGDAGENDCFKTSRAA